MNPRQLLAIQSLTSRILVKAFGSAKKELVFTIEADKWGGYTVIGQNLDTSWTAVRFMAIATVGPRGGVRHYREYK